MITNAANREEGLKRATNVKGRTDMTRKMEFGIDRMQQTTANQQTKAMLYARYYFIF